MDFLRVYNAARMAGVRMPERPASAKTPSELIPIVYKELRSLAAAYMRKERPSHTLQPTALVHEAYLALARSTRMSLKGKTHFVAIAAIQMRRVLVDHARRRNAKKRGGDWQRITLDEKVAVTPEGTVDLLVLDGALDRLAELSPRQSRIAVYRLFGELGEREIAELLELSERTVRGEWKVAKTWLARELSSH